jgi:hypothetical protein
MLLFGECLTSLSVDFLISESGEFFFALVKTLALWTLFLGWNYWKIAKSKGFKRKVPLLVLKKV